MFFSNNPAQMSVNKMNKKHRMLDENKMCNYLKYRLKLAIEKLKTYFLKILKYQEHQKVLSENHIFI